MALSETQQKEMISNIGEVKGILAESRKQGKRVTILSIPVRLLMIDERYQTPVRTERSLAKLINNWDENKLLPLTVVPHDEEGVFAVVDGNGRMTASQKVNPEKYTELMCMVILSAPTEPEARLVFEAEQYAFQNDSVSPVTDIQKHGAREVCKDKAALILDEMKAKYDFHFATTNKGRRSAHTLGSYSDALSICQVQGKEGMDWICNILRESAFDRQSDGMATIIVRSLRDMYTMYPSSRNEISTHLCKKLRGMAPDLLYAQARTKYPLLDKRMACSIYIEDELVKAIGVSHVRKLNDNKNKIVKVA